MFSQFQTPSSPQLLEEDTHPTHFEIEPEWQTFFDEIAKEPQQDLKRSTDEAELNNDNSDATPVQPAKKRKLDPDRALFKFKTTQQLFREQNQDLRYVRELTEKIIQSKEALLQENTQLKADHTKLSEQVQSLTQQNNRLIGTNRLLSKSEITTEKNHLEREKAALKKQQQTLDAEKARFAKQCQQFEISKQQLLQQQQKLITNNLQLSALNQQLNAQVLGLAGYSTQTFFAPAPPSLQMKHLQPTNTPVNYLPYMQQ